MSFGQKTDSIASGIVGKLAYQAGGLKNLIALLIARFRNGILSTGKIPGASGLATSVVAFAALYTLNKALNRRVTGGRGAKDAFKPEREIVLITGGSSGLGLLMAEMFAKRAVKVAVIDVNPSKSPLPAGIRFYQADVTSPPALHEAAEAIRQDLGDPTVIVNNAGLVELGSIINVDPAKTQRLLNVNVGALFWVAKEFLPAMVAKDHGHVVTVASLASFYTMAGIVDYCCSKAAALAFHEGLTQELKHRYNAPGIRTTVVHPSWTLTPMTEVVAKNSGNKMLEPETVASAVVNQVASGRGGQLMLPWEISYLSGLRGFPIWLQEYFRDQNAGLLQWTHE
ncbi:hypothetical protein LQW54_009246 [Pestalotiopsis sp. IQ-011]